MVPAPDRTAPGPPSPLAAPTRPPAPGASADRAPPGARDLSPPAQSPGGARPRPTRTSSVPPHAGPPPQPGPGATPLSPTVPGAALPTGCDRRPLLLPTGPKTTTAPAQTTTPRTLSALRALS